MTTATLTAERIKELLSYDPATGYFEWKESRRGVTAGSRAGSVDGGYRSIKVDGGDYYAHRLAWLWVHGKMPKRLRFLNGDTDDCRIENLAESFSLPGWHDSKTKEGRAAYMAKYRLTRREHLSSKERERTFGIDAKRYVEMVEEQSGLCAICGRPERETRNGKVKALAVDHCHETGRIRGLLCVACNTGLGKLGDNREVLLKAVAYLDRHGH